jgi:CRISPR-associated endonuclease/helicase Cas3
MLEHASEVSRIAGENASAFGESQRAELMGKLHDLGKYGDLFQRRLRGEESGLDHWTAGTYVALMTYRFPDVALCIQGHHIGLQRGDKDSLETVFEKQPNPEHLRLTDENFALLRTRLENDVGALPLSSDTRMHIPSSASAMLDTRMMFSALVDADFLDTERTMNRGNDAFVPRPKAPGLQAKRALSLLEARLSELNADTRIPQNTRELRRSLADTALVSASSPARLFTLTAPTGTGKTLAMLRFALARAAADERVRRIILVLPFLTILDQTVDVYRALFAELGAHYILEHHSLVGTRAETGGSAVSDGVKRSDKQQRLLMENWDAPIVITTSVQFLESLHANRTSACRKLHNIAGSIVLFDEVQSLPLNLAVPTLKTLSRLASDKYGCSVVFSTATQPAFDTLHPKILEGEPQSAGWQPVEIVTDHAALFQRAKRVEVTWKTRSPSPWSEVLHWLEEDRQALCIVNLKRHASALAKRALEANLEGVYHLSTALCPQHRRELLKRIIADLKAGNACRVIATQCVEAGVDLDFPKVYRALAGLDAIAQAAGRCNRNAARPQKGQLTVFVPEEENYPSKTYRQAAELTRVLLAERTEGLDLDDPTTYRQFYRSLYTLTSTSDAELEGFITSQNYLDFAARYRLIENDAVNVVVPYNEAALELMQEGRQLGITPDWMRRVRGYTVSYFLKKNAPVPVFLEPIKFRFGKNDGFAEGWFLCAPENPLTFKRYYDEVFGLQSEEGGS